MASSSKPCAMQKAHKRVVYKLCSRFSDIKIEKIGSEELETIENTLRDKLDDILETHEKILQTISVEDVMQLDDVVKAHEEYVRKLRQKIRDVEVYRKNLSNMPTLAGKVCVVTGATRGIGKGIALQLAEKGAKVYITGRTLDPPKNRVGGSLRDTAREVEARGGVCVPVQCDHSKDDEVKQLFELVKRENDGQLDILVNNAYAAVNAIFESVNKQQRFWESDMEMWDTVNNVGLRNHYFCAWYAAQMMVPRKRGLIVNISSGGGLRYLFNAAYGIGKAACDRMAADLGFELRKQNVAFVSLWPGAVATETVLDLVNNDTEANSTNSADRASGDQASVADKSRAKMRAMFSRSETTEYAGQCIAEMANDPLLMKMSGKIVLTYDLGKKYCLVDKEGHIPMDMCSVKGAMLTNGHTWMAALTPSFLRFPKWMMCLAGNKFF